VSYVLLRTGAFSRAARRLMKKDRSSSQHLEGALRQLQADPHHPSLKTHKLKGELRECWACSAGYDLRIIFEFTRHAGKAAILLLSIGTHDEIY